MHALSLAKYKSCHLEASESSYDYENRLTFKERYFLDIDLGPMVSSRCGLLERLHSLAVLVSQVFDLRSFCLDDLHRISNERLTILDGISFGSLMSFFGW
jgi:hypothetical protein